MNGNGRKRRRESVKSKNIGKRKDVEKRKGRKERN